MLFAPVFHGRVTRPAAASSRSAGVAPIQCLTPTFLGPSAYILLSDVQTSLIFFFPGPQPSCHPSLWVQYLTPTFIGHLLKQGVPKKYLQNPVPHPHRWPSAYNSLSEVPCVCKHLQYLISGGALQPSLTFTLIHQIIDIQHH